MEEFKDKIAVVTGGAQGIGRCIAEEFRKAIRFDIEHLTGKEAIELVRGRQNNE